MINEIVLDTVMLALGEMIAERRHRKEEEKSVLVDIHLPGERIGTGYALCWNIGNTLDILYYPSDEGIHHLKLVTIWLSADGIEYGRGLAEMICGIISGYERGKPF